MFTLRNVKDGIRLQGMKRFWKNIFRWLPSAIICGRQFMTTVQRIQEVRVRFAPSPTGSVS